MGILRKIYEVRVKVGQEIRSFHFEKNSQRAAVEAGQKRGRVVSVRKVDRQVLLGNIEKLDLTTDSVRSYLGGGIYEDDLNIDGVLGLQSKENHRKRIENKKIDKEVY